MVKKEKPSSKDFDAQAEAKKKLKQAEKAGTGAKKDKSEKADSKKKSVKLRRYLKDFRGELKKIVWPDIKTVLKNTGIVLVTTVIIGVPVWILDYGLSEGVLGLKKLAQGSKTEAVVPTPNFDYEDFLAQLEEESLKQAETVAGYDETELVNENRPEPAIEPITDPAE